MKIKDEVQVKAYKPSIDEDGLLDMIAKCAYFKSEKRDFEAGYEEQNWLEAEEEVNRTRLWAFFPCDMELALQQSISI